MQGVNRRLVIQPVKWHDVRDTTTPQQPYVALSGDGQARTGFLVRYRNRTSRWHATAENQWGPWIIGGPIECVRALLEVARRSCITLHIEGSSPRDVQWRLDPNA